MRLSRVAALHRSSPRLAVFVVGCNEIGIPVVTESPPSGIRGVVTLSPTCPVEASPGANDPEPCVTFYAATLVVLDGESAVVTRVTSGSGWPVQRQCAARRVRRWRPRPDRTRIRSLSRSRSIVVPGQYAEVEINYDTGIR